MCAAVTQQREETPVDEVRVMHNGHIAMYVKYAARLFTEQNKEKITVRASGSAIPLAISTIEILRRRIVGLHQEVTIGRSQLVHEVPAEERAAAAAEGGEGAAGEKQTRTRSVPYLHVILSKNIEHVNTKSPGYEKPLDPSLVEKFKELREPSPNSNNGAAVGNAPSGDDMNPRENRGSFRGGNGRRARGRGGRFGGGLRGRGGMGRGTTGGRSSTSGSPPLAHQQ